MEQSLTLEPIKKEIEEVLYDNQEIVIASQDDYNHAGDVVKTIKFKIKQIEEKRVAYTKPLLDQKKLIDDDFKALMKPLEELVKAIDAKCLEFYRAEKKRLDEEQKRIEAEAMEKAKEENVCDVEVPVVNDIKTTRGQFSTNTVKLNWTYKIVDESQIPREFLTVDEKKLRAYAVSNKEKAKVAGVEFYQEESMSRR